MLKENFIDDYKTSDYETERHKPMPSLNHGSIQTNIIVELAAYKKNYRTVSEMSLELSEWPSVPDISLIPRKAMDTWDDQIKVYDPPLCVVEILSPTQSLTELIVKAKNYFEHGVKSCWLVIPGLNNVYVFSSPEEYEIFKIGETLNDKTMDIKIEVDRVFE